MVKIRIISGGYGYKENGINKLKDRNSDPFFVDEAEAENLTTLGVAEIVGTSVATPVNDDFNTEAMSNTDEEENGYNGENEAKTEDDETGDTVSGHLDEEQLQSMTNKELKNLAEDMGIDTSKMKVKKDFIEAILELDVLVDDEDLPNLSTEEPVE